MDPAVEAVRARSLARLKKAGSKACAAKVVVEAGRAGWIDGLRYLAGQGADLNASHRNYRALHSLIQEKPHASPGGTEDRNECLRWLLEHGANPELGGAWPSARAILVATWVGEPMYVETLRAGGAVVDGFVAAAMGDVDQVRRTLDADATFARARDATGLTALHCATASRMIRIDVARLLLDRGAEVHATVRSWDHDVDAPYFAVSSGQLDVFELLLDRGADPTAALPAGAWKADPAFADAALRRGADPDKATSGGRPLLNDLVRWGQVTQALWLLGRGASPNVADPQGWTALHQAASRGNERMLRAVLDAGGDKRARDRGGMVPRDIAQVMGRRKLLPLL